MRQERKNQKKKRRNDARTCEKRQVKNFLCFSKHVEDLNWQHTKMARMHFCLSQQGINGLRETKCKIKSNEG